MLIRQSKWFSDEGYYFILFLNSRVGKDRTGYSNGWTPSSENKTNFKLELIS